MTSGVDSVGAVASWGGGRRHCGFCLLLPLRDLRRKLILLLGLINCLVLFSSPRSRPRDFPGRGDEDGIGAVKGRRLFGGVAAGRDRDV